jgi:hypothetical protein
MLTTSFRLSNILTQKHHLQLSLSVRTPPNIGPTMLDMPNMLPTAPMNIGLCRNGIENAMIVIPPENSPAAPNPATALPMINTLELFARAHTIEPTT